MVKIVFSQIAKRDLKSIIEYIKQDSPYYAEREKNRIKDAIDQLITQPELGKVFVRFNDPTYRELIYRHYSIIYKIISEQRIDILTIHHHSRSFSNNPAFNSNDE